MYVTLMSHVLFYPQTSVLTGQRRLSAYFDSDSSVTLLSQSARKSES